jgi:hypothetical protein
VKNITNGFLLAAGLSTIRVVQLKRALFALFFKMKRPQGDANQLVNRIVSSICIGFSPLL